MRPELRPPESQLSPLDDVVVPTPKTRSINLNWLIVLLVAAGLGLAGWKVLGLPGDGWLHDFDAGIDAAEASGKPMFVLYTADWCPPCRELKRNVLSDPGVDAFLSENFVRVKIDLTDRNGPNAIIASEYGVTGIPTAIVYGDDGRELDRVTGGSALAYWLGNSAY